MSIVAPRPWYLLVPALCAYATCSLAQARQEDRNFVQITLPTKVAPNTTVAIAEVGAPEFAVAKDGDTIQSLVGYKCGSVDQIYFRLVREANKDISLDLFDGKLPSGLKIVLPACASRPKAETITLAPGDTLGKFLPPAVLPSKPIDVQSSAARRDQIYKKVIQLPFGERITIPIGNDIRVLSTAGAKAVNEIVIASSNSAVPIKDPNKITAGQAIVVPGQVPAPRTIPLRADFDIPTAVSRLNVAASYDGVDASRLVQQSDEAKLPTPLSGPEAHCSTAPDSESWPLPIKQILEQRKINEAFRTGLGLGVAESITLVLDTGFDFRGVLPGFPAARFPGVKSMRAKLTQFGGKDEPDFTRDGVNLASLRTGGGTAGAYYVGDKDMRWHGAAVVSAALGTRKLDSDLLSHGGAIVAASAIRYGTAMPYSAPEALGSSMKYASEIGAKIINYSFEIGQDPRIDSHISDFVLVAAAGNSGGWSDSWPARYGGDIGVAKEPLVITVGGHEPSGMIWKYSNRNARRVDILAPSCDVPVYEGIEAEGKKTPVESLLAGTSFAAPVVSFVASLLGTEHLSPLEIKYRFLTSAYVDGQVIDHTFSGGVLDAPAALSVYQDVVRKNVDGHLRHWNGRIVDEASIISLCGTSKYAGNLQKLSVYERDGKRKAMAWINESGTTSLLTRDCDIGDGAIDLKFETSDGSILNLSRDDNFDYLRAHFHP